MCSKIYGGVVLLAAIAMAAFVINVSIDNVDHVMKVLKFFDVMIPVLAVGALIKYIFSGRKGKCGNCGSGKCGNKEV